MQATDPFKAVINNHLQGLAENDSLFAETLKKPGKNIDDCCTYILNQVKKSGKNGFADDEIFGMAVHYYDEDDIQVGAKVNGRVVVNHHVAKAKTDDSKKQPVKSEKKPLVNQDSLF